MNALVLGPSYALLEAAVPERMRAWIQRRDYQINNLINAAWVRTDEYARDISFASAVSAYSGTSHVPETRAYRVIYDYAAHMRESHATFLGWAEGDPDREAMAAALFDAYRDGYRTRFRAYLGSRGGMVSSMIAGPARFPVAAQQRKSDAVDAKWAELSEWSRRATADAMRALKEAKIEAGGGAIADLERRIAERQRTQETYKQINAIIRKKLDDEAKVAAIMALGLSETAARKTLLPDFAGRIGIPAYALQNNLAEIKRLQARIDDERAKAAVVEAVEGGTTATEFPFPAKGENPSGTVVYNTDIDRVQVVYAVERVPRNLYDTLRRYGFVFSPRERAFQRRLNQQGVNAASIVTGIDLPWSGA